MRNTSSTINTTFPMLVLCGAQPAHRSINGCWMERAFGQPPPMDPLIRKQGMLITKSTVKRKRKVASCDFEVVFRQVERTQHSKENAAPPRSRDQGGTLSCSRAGMHRPAWSSSLPCPSYSHGGLRRKPESRGFIAAWVQAGWLAGGE